MTFWLTLRWWGCGLVLVGALLAGCVRQQVVEEWPQPASGAKRSPPSPAATPSPIVTAAHGTTGRITSVNATARYVVITYPVGIPLPAVDQRLNVYHAGLKVAELKVTGPSRDTNTIGDITAGECQLGDEVRAD